MTASATSKCIPRFARTSFSITPKNSPSSAAGNSADPIAGHLIGQFPHERIPQDKISLYVHPENNLRMRDKGEDDRERHWILEIHFVDRARQIGGFYEELLTVG